jgi:hypothetical protein
VNESDTIILGPPVAGTSLITRFRACGTLRMELEPLYCPPIPRPANVMLEAILEAQRSGYTAVRVGERVCRVVPDRPARVNRPAMRLASDERPGVLRRLGTALHLVKDRA